ncbi:MAG: arylsulfotransferase family protein [Acidimicrobiales bacterium]
MTDESAVDAELEGRAGTEKVTRRGFLTSSLLAGGGLAALGGAAFGGYEWPHGASSAKPPSSPGKPAAARPSVDAFSSREEYEFVTRPDLHPPRVTLTRAPHYGVEAAGDPRHIFVSPKGYKGTGPGQQGLMIFDTDGRLVWFKPLLGADNAPFDFQLQSYRGKPVLTWFQGKVIAGHGEGTCYIADSSYRTIASVQAGNGLKADLHELNLTPAGTALITAYGTVNADLRPIGGPKRGQVLTCQAQEIDIATGKLVFSWDSLDHVPIEDTYSTLAETPKGTPLDYFHMNSIALAADGNLIISSRNTWAIYKVSRTTGEVIWRLNGKHSSFKMGPGASFYWQHHVRAHPGSLLSIFDDGASPAEESQSRAIFVHLDETSMTATLQHAYTHPAPVLAGNQGSVQLLDNGQVFVGWGNQPYFSQFLHDGSMILDGRLPDDDQSYRAFVYDFVATPTEMPALALRSVTTGGHTLYVSWNGATHVHSWEVLAGKTATGLTRVATAWRTGFETAITVLSDGPYFAVVALDHKGTEIGRSKPVKMAVPA